MDLISVWYTWGQFAALFVTVAVLFWIFAARRGVRAIAWKVFAILCVVLVLPSIIFWGVPTLFTGNLAALEEPFVYIGLGAVALALLVLVLHLAGIGERGRTLRCLVCGEPQHPSWDYCPYCRQREVQFAVSATSLPNAPSPVYAPPSSTTAPLEPLTPIASLPFEGPQPRSDETELIGPQREEFAWLILLSGAHSGKEFPLGETTAIGRDPARNDIVIDDSAVSRQHAKIRLREGHFVLTDLASTDGTYVKDQNAEGGWTEVHEHILKDGDQIKMGRMTFAFIHVKKGNG